MGHLTHYDDAGFSMDCILLTERQDGLLRYPCTIHPMMRPLLQSKQQRQWLSGGPSCCLSWAAGGWPHTHTAADLVCQS